MGLPKGARTIVVGDERYRWFVSDSELRQFDYIMKPALGLSVQHASGDGAKLLTWILVGDGVAITPGFVRALIEHGLARGWKPTERGEDVVVAADGIEPSPSRV